MANNTYTELNPGSGGSKMDETRLTVDGVEVDSPRVVIRGDDAAAELAAVKNADQGVVGAVYGLVVRLVGKNPVVSYGSDGVENVGTTSDDDTSSTVIGRLKKLVSLITARLPASLGAGGGVKIDGSGTPIAVDGSAVTQPVSGSVSVSNFPATQPVSGPLTDSQLRASAVPVSAAALPLPSGAATSALQGGGLPAALGAGGGLKVDGSGTPLPVSGTVTGNQGTAAALSGGWPVKVTDGTNAATVKAGSTAPSVADPALVVALSPNSSIRTSLDVLGELVAGSRNNKIEIDFYADPGAGLITNNTAGGASITQSSGHTLYATGAGASSQASGVSVASVDYRPANEIYAYFTAAFTTPTSANSYQRIGMYNATNGFILGYEGLTFGVTKRTGAADTFTASASWNGDPLDGSAASQFTRAGAPEAIDFTTSNLYRIRFAWLGSASILFEVFSPDGVWVTFHTIRQPNSTTLPSLTNPTLPMTVDVKKTGADATVLTVATACWAAGTTSDLSKITDTLTDNTLARLTRSVITGRSTSGGGSYVNVKVTPSGSLTTAIGDISGVVGQNTMANSVPVTIASNQSPVPGSNAAGSQVDGHSATIGATTDAYTAPTVIGRLNNIIYQLTSSILKVAIDQTTPGTTNAVVARGPVASGSSAAGNSPVLLAGVDGGNLVRVPLVDTNQRLWTVPSGFVASGGAVAGALNPLLIAGQDGSNVRTFKTDTDGTIFTRHIAPASQTSKYYTTSSAATGDAVWTPNSNKKVAITSIVVSTYGTTSARLTLWFGSSAGGTVYNPLTNQTVMVASFAPSATSKPGLVYTPAVPVFCNNADYLLRVTTDAAMSVDITVYGYEF